MCPKKKVRAAVAEIEGTDNFIINSTETVTERYAISMAEFIKHAQKIES